MRKLNGGWLQGQLEAHGATREEATAIVSDYFQLVGREEWMKRRTLEVVIQLQREEAAGRLFPNWRQIYGKLTQWMRKTTSRIRRGWMQDHGVKCTLGDLPTADDRRGIFYPPGGKTRTAAQG